MSIAVGQRAARSLTLTAEHVRKFAEISGDHNPLHFDAAFAARTKFGRNISSERRLPVTPFRGSGSALQRPIHSDAPHARRPPLRGRDASASRLRRLQSQCSRRQTANNLSWGQSVKCREHLESLA